MGKTATESRTSSRKKKSPYFREQNSTNSKSKNKSSKTGNLKLMKEKLDTGTNAKKCNQKTGNTKQQNTSLEPRSQDSMRRAAFSFFDRPCIDLAKVLLGQKLVRKVENGQCLVGRIVETEAYTGYEDKAAHSYKGKRTASNEAMYMPPGTAYVYHIYGMYRCINISSQGEGHAVLIRGLEPLEGLDTMRTLRSKKRKSSSAELKDHQLCDGPSKLCEALAVTKEEINKVDMVTSGAIWVEEDDTVDSVDIVAAARIGVDYAEEWAKKPLRFYIRNNKSVSVRDKKAEEASS